MRKYVVYLAIVVLFVIDALGQNHESEPLTLAQVIEMPDVPLGPYADHPAVDVKGHRLFAAAQAHKSVKVFDLDTGKEIYDILGIENPHSILYREDLDQIYITDGGAGLLRIYSGRNYHPIKAIKLQLDADSVGYDPATKYLYVDNGGKNAKLDYSLISVIDTTKSEVVGEIKIQAQSLEGIAFSTDSPRSYVNLTDKNQIAVFDREKRTVLKTWPLVNDKKNIPIALDEKRNRLFVGSRNAEDKGAIVVLDAQNGHEISSLPIAGWVDYIAFDVKTKRIYASCGKGPDGIGSVYVYQENKSGGYDLVANPATAPMAKAGLYVPELDRFYVAVPHTEGTPAKILVFQVCTSL